MSNVTPITARNGDGIGPEIMSACLHIIREAAEAAGKAAGDGLDLIMIDNRGVKVWPDGMAETLCTDAYRVRFSSKNGTTSKQTVALLNRVLDQGIEIVKTETLRNFDSKAGYTLAQGL